MSNTRRIDLDKLAAILTGQPGAPRHPRGVHPARSAFPRIPAGRFKALLDRPQARATDGPGAP